jgi:hypothetical protein
MTRTWLSAGRPYRATSAKTRDQDARLRRVALRQHAPMTNANHTQNGIVPRRAHDLADKVDTADPLCSEPTHRYFSPTALRSYPYRCPQYLEWLWERADSVNQAAERAGCSHTTMSRWLAVFAIRGQDSTYGSAHAANIRNNIDPEDLGLSPAPEPEGSA